MKLFRFIFFTILFTSIQVFAGTTGKISGRITDAETGEALPGVNIIVADTYWGAATDLDGYYVILNIPPGEYSLNVSMIGYATQTIREVRVQIDQTSVINVVLGEETLDISEEIVVVAERPIVERDVAASRANINFKEIEALPVVSVASVVALQAGIEGSSMRGGGSDEVAWIVNGITLRNERNNTSYNALSYTSVEEVQVQTGGFSSEYGNIRSGVVNVITKEGGKNKYNFGFIGRYRAAAPKHFGQSPNSPNSYWIRPYVDDDVCWVGTANGTWDKAMQAQYDDFIGFNTLSETLMGDGDPSNDLSPAALQQLYLWEHRRQLDIKDPDYSVDMSFGGPIPFISQMLGNLRFHTSYRESQSMYIVPLSDDGYRDYTWQGKITSDIMPGMKLMLDVLMGQESGTAYSSSGGPGLFQSAYGVAEEFNTNTYGDGALFGTDYWARSKIDYTSIGLRLTQALSEKTFYEASLSRFSSEYDTNPSNYRDSTLVQMFGNDYWVNEAPFGLYEATAPSLVNSMRMGSAPFSSARDSSFVATYTAKMDLTIQYNRFNNIKIGGEFNVSDSRINYGRVSDLIGSNSHTEWDKTPIRGALYIQDKLEFEGMVAQLGLRMDYSHAGGEWYSGYNVFDEAFSAKYAPGIDTLLNKKATDHNVTFSPRLAIAFPITVNSKLYFNYGHFRQMPSPENLYLLRTHPYSQIVQWVANPNMPLPKTVAYELGYEHNLFDQYLVRVAGYYKDVSSQPKTVTYSTTGDEVNYSTSEPNSYEDIRGFEITLNKNRGHWFRGFVNYTYMVSTTGFFGYDHYYENPVRQAEYEWDFKKHYQYKPIPRPYARANLDFFTPKDFGPSYAGFRPLDSWRLNILANWKEGSYTTWTGPGRTPPGVQYNVQWRDYWNVNLRFAKNFKLGSANFEFFMDISNVFNFKRLSYTGFFDGTDYNDYRKSLHFSKDIDGYDKFSYVNIPGDDRLGDYRKRGVDFVPITTYTDATESFNYNAQDLYYFKNSLEGVHGKGYYRYIVESDSWVEEDSKRVNQILDDKAYIDMPNFKYFTFLNPRNIFWGMKLSFEL